MDGRIRYTRADTTNIAYQIVGDGPLDLVLVPGWATHLDLAWEIQGVAVHVAARVAALAGPREVLVSQTVREVASGAGFRFTDRGTHELRGVPGRWALYAAELPEPA